MTFFEKIWEHTNTEMAKRMNLKYKSLKMYVEYIFLKLFCSIFICRNIRCVYLWCCFQPRSLILWTIFKMYITFWIFPQYFAGISFYYHYELFSLCNTVHHGSSEKVLKVRDSRKGKYNVRLAASPWHPCRAQPCSTSGPVHRLCEASINNSEAHPPPPADQPH